MHTAKVYQLDIFNSLEGIFRLSSYYRRLFCEEKTNFMISRFLHEHLSHLKRDDGRPKIELTKLLSSKCTYSS